jgi:hypothetical protein
LVALGAVVGSAVCCSGGGGAVVVVVVSPPLNIGTTIDNAAMASIPVQTGCRRGHDLWGSAGGDSCWVMA